MMIYSDGAIEAMNSDFKLYGKDRFFASFLANREMAPGSLVKRLRKDLSAFVGNARQNDDITIFVTHLG